MKFKETLIAMVAAVLLYIPLLVVGSFYGEHVGELIPRIVNKICH